MKTLKLICLLVIVTTLHSCDKCHKKLHHYTPVWLSFQDASGNDLVNGIEYDAYSTGHGEIKSELIDLYINYDGIYSLSDWALGYNTVSIIKQDNYYYIGCGLVFTECDPLPNKITFKFRCPHIFGDNYLHEITTYWNTTKKKYHECYRIEYEGKEFSVNEQSQSVTIILDNK